MDEAAQQLRGEHDFASFVGQMAREPASRTTVRRVDRIGCWQGGGVIGIEIGANAFLRHMVRGIVGTLVLVGRGRLDTAQFGKIIEAADRREGGPNAPPHGLTLTGVEYPAVFLTEQVAPAERVARGLPSGADAIGTMRFGPGVSAGVS